MQVAREDAALNITAPFKGDAFEFVENNPFGLAGECSERAKLAKAVNTLWIENGQVRGDNTDGVGLVCDLTNNLGWEIKNKHVLVIGAGGAVRGVMAPLLQQGPSRLVVVNRTLKRVVELVQQLQQGDSVSLRDVAELEEWVQKAGLLRDIAWYARIKSLFRLLFPIKQEKGSDYGIFAYEWQESGYGLRGGTSPKDKLSEHELLKDSQFDLVINGTSASLTGDLPPLSPALLAKDAGCYDMVYGKPTAFMQWATENGIEKVTDGLGMLVEQAAESFCIWRGNNPEKRPDTAPVLKDLRAVNTTRPGG